MNLNHFIKPTVVFFSAQFAADLMLNKEKTFHNHSEQQYPIVSQAVNVYGIINTGTGATQANYANEVRLATK